MADGKKSFLFYTNWESTFENLTDDEAGRLIKHMLRYVNDKNPEPPDRITQLVFEPIKAVLKGDLNKWEDTKEERSNSGKLGNLKRWNPDLYELVTNNKLAIKDAEIIALQRKLSHSDKNNRTATEIVANVAVNDNVNDNVNVNVNEREKKGDSPENYNGDYQIQIENLENELLQDRQWVESLARVNKFDTNSAENSIAIAEGWIKSFVLDLKTENVKQKNRADAFSHCKRWINTQLKNGKQSQIKTNRRTIAGTGSHSAESL